VDRQSRADAAGKEDASGLRVPDQGLGNFCAAMNQIDDPGRKTRFFPPL